MAIKRFKKVVEYKEFDKWFPVKSIILSALAFFVSYLEFIFDFGFMNISIPSAIGGMFLSIAIFHIIEMFGEENRKVYWVEVK